MDLKEMLWLGIHSLMQRKLRSFLTILGIIIGISTIILLIGLAQGLKEDVIEELETFGPRTILVVALSNNTLVVGPMANFVPTAGFFSEKDYQRLKRIPGIKTISKILKGRAAVVYKEQIIDAEAFGVEPRLFKDVVEFEVEQGRFLEEDEHFTAVLGSQVAASFDEEVKVNSNIYIGGRRFKVVGIFERTGSSIAPIDDIIAINFEDARDIFALSPTEDRIDAIRMTVEEEADVNEVAGKVEEALLASRRVTEKDKDFTVMTPDFFNAQFSEILDLITLFLGSIASISLVVGGIGISNNMFMSVMERRREIGTLKAVGATQTQIKNIFLIESSIIGLLGGLLGLAIAAVVALGLMYFGGMTFVFDPFIITGALLFSIVVGMVSGTLPAMEAAKLSPMMALRYE